MLTFLAGAELNPLVFRAKWKEATAFGLVGFFGPFLGCTAIAHYILQWSVRSSWLAGVALSTTSVAVVYAVMLELGFNRTEFGKAILAACFIKPATSVELEAVLDDAREHYEQGLKGVKQKAQQHDVKLETDIAVGHPAEQIIHRAETDKIDLVILGRRGKSMFEKLIMGSTSARVLRYAHCPVMVVT